MYAIFCKPISFQFLLPTKIFSQTPSNRSAKALVTYTRQEELQPSARQLVKEFFVERLVFVSRPHREEDVTSDVLVNDLAVGGQTLKRQFVVLESHLNLLDFPVDAPRLHVLVSPSLEGVTFVQIHADHTIGSNGQQLLGKQMIHSAMLSKETTCSLHLGNKYH